MYLSRNAIHVLFTKVIKVYFIRSSHSMFFYRKYSIVSERRDAVTHFVSKFTYVRTLHGLNYLRFFLRNSGNYKSHSQ
jgi:hypothetical protein